MPRSFKGKIEEYILNYPIVSGQRNDEEIKGRIHTELLKYYLFCSNLPDDDPRLHDRLVNYDITLPDFWRMYRNDFPLLYPLGLRIFSLVCSSASAQIKVSFILN